MLLQGVWPSHAPAACALLPSSPRAEGAAAPPATAGSGAEQQQRRQRRHSYRWQQGKRQHPAGDRGGAGQRGNAVQAGHLLAAASPPRLVVAGLARAGVRYHRVQRRRAGRHGTACATASSPRGAGGFDGGRSPELMESLHSVATAHVALGTASAPSTGELHLPRQHLSAAGSAGTTDGAACWAHCTAGGARLGACTCGVYHAAAAQRRAT